MKVKILKNFIDKETGKFKLEGNELECTVDRAKELEKQGYVKLLEEVKEIKKNLAEEDGKKETGKKINKKTIAKKD